MRFITAAMVLALVGCSQEPAPPAAPPAAPAGPRFEARLTDPAQLSTPVGSPIRITASQGGLELRNFVASADAQLKTDGASVALGAANEAAFAGHRVLVTIRARGEEGATAFTAAYSTHGDGNSGWRRMPVTDTMHDATFAFDVPAVRRAQDDFVGINPPEHGAIEVQAISVELADAAPPRP